MAKHCVKTFCTVKTRLWEPQLTCALSRSGMGSGNETYHACSSLLSFWRVTAVKGSPMLIS